MIVKHIGFNPHLVWAQKDGFHVWGYGGVLDYDIRLYKYLAPNYPIKTIQDSTFFPLRFNHVVPNEKNLILTASTYHVSIPHDYLPYSYHNILENLIFSVTHPSVTCAFIEVYKKRKIPTTANFDRHDDNIVFAWGKSLFLSSKKGDYYLQTESSCTDAKISPDGETLAYSVGNFVYFMDISTKVIKYTMDLNKRILHLAYSLDGLTIAAITASKQLFIWDIDIIYEISPLVRK
jgi:hypothetical protein